MWNITELPLGFKVKVDWNIQISSSHSQQAFVLKQLKLIILDLIFIV